MNSIAAIQNPAGSELVPTVVRVRSFRQETSDTFTLSLDNPENGRSFTPGQFNMLYAFGIGEAAISLSGDPTDTHQVVHTIRAVGSVTRALARLEVGSTVGIRGPFGTEWPVPSGRGGDILLVAGGIGLAPLRPVIYQLLHQRKDYRRIVLFYGARTPSDLLYSEEFATWRLAGIEVVTTVDRPDANWTGSVGLVTALFSRIEVDSEQTLAMICGPEIMMRFVQREFEKRGVQSNRIYLSLERNMHCAIGFCGHCQFGPEFVCQDGPVFRYDRIERFFNIREA